MATLRDEHNPSFLLFPINNRNTAWRPIGYPVILVVPHRRDAGGTPLSNSSVFSVRIFIEEVPQEALVAGHDHVGQRFPDRELYAETVDSFELSERQINLMGYQFYHNGVLINGEDAIEGDIFQFTTSTGVTDTIPYIPHADYYDISDFKVDVETLPPDRYILAYSAEYFSRIISQDGSEDLLCIDANQTSIAKLKLTINHPGDVMEEMYRLTPPPYLTNATKALDTTVAFYRPFTDIIQDISDEQDLLERINWVFDAPPEAVPYLSALLGWELPYFPESLDALRRAVLRRTVEFQNIKGSRQALISLFRLFGFEILISNLWWSSDGQRFIRPGETLPPPYTDQQIIVANICQVDLVLNNWTTTGFGDFDIPLLFRPQVPSGFADFGAVRDGGNVTVEAYVVATDSEAYAELQTIAAAIYVNPSGYGSIEGCTVDANGFLNSDAISTAMAGKEVLGFSQVLITGKLGEATSEVVTGIEIPLRRINLSFNRETNILHLTLNGYFDLTDKAVFAFVIYERQQLMVPDIIADLQSNRFDIQIVTQDLTEFADPTTLEFALEFINRLKAFHSLLNVVRTTIEFTETYEVADWCVGGDVQQRYDTDAGQLQVPPAIIPNIPSDINDCTLLDPNSLGYKPDDILLRIRKLTNLPEEHAAWKLLDSRTASMIEGLLLSPLAPADRPSCLYTQFGQDRVTSERTEATGIEHNPSPTAAQQIAGYEANPRLSPNDISVAGVYDTTGPKVSSNSDSSAYGSIMRQYTEIRTPVCELNSTEDYCYKGRVDDELLYRPTLLPEQVVQLRACSLGLGMGLYYTYPSRSVVVLSGVARPARGSLSNQIMFSGEAPAGNIQHFLDSQLQDYLTVSYDQKLPNKYNSHLGRLYRDYDVPDSETLHYYNRNTMPDLDQRQNLAIQRPSLNIEKPTLHLPGCRFPRLNALTTDFTHPTWDARPWDDQYSTYCGPKFVCGTPEPTFLNAYLADATSDNEMLVFDVAPFTILGNGLIPDIPSLGNQTLGTDAFFETSDVIHAVYMGLADSPYVELEQVCPYDSAVSADGTIIVTDPLFYSHNSCGTAIVDYADGYGCITGEQIYDGEDYSVWYDVWVGLGAPVADANTGSTVLFLLGSGILAERGIRLDCGCLLVDCDGTDGGTAGSIESSCAADLFLDSDDVYDWSPDHLQLELRLLEEEQIGVCSTILNGEIPTLLELII